MKLTEEIAIATLRNFFHEKPFLFIGSGVSCALDTRFGVSSLQGALMNAIRTYPLSNTQETEWEAVSTALRNGVGFEPAFNAINDQDLLRIVTEITGSFIAEADQVFAFRIAQGDSEWPADRLLRKLVDKLPEGDPILHVLTPNYDMLFEYGCDYAGISYTDGFFGGIERKTDWRAVDQALRVPVQVCRGKRQKTYYKYRKHVRLYKVHGSLNYFFHRNSVIENNAWMWNPPNFAQRVMVTPGLSKYRTLQKYRQELLQSADAAINKATRFLFIGYGFNDIHLEEYIKRKLITQGSKGLIVTRDSNPRIESLLAQAHNLWLVCRSEDESSEGSRIFNGQYADWLSLPSMKLWDIKEFTARILGG